MALEMCIDSAAWILHAIDVGAPNTIRGFHLRWPGTGESQLAAADVACEEASFDSAVREATDDLTATEIQALWLIDVCGSTYEVAAREARVTEVEIADRVASGRRTIRSKIEGV